MAANAAGKVMKTLKIAVGTLIFIAAALLLFRIYDVKKGPELERWHTYTPEEMTVRELDSATWSDYLKREEQIFNDVRKNITDRIHASADAGGNRYFAKSPVYPPHFARDWNRSFILKPKGTAVGVAVLLHGLTDAPYTLRHIAKHYTERGFISIGLRIPGHGTVPAALSNIEWETWLAAVRLAVREAQKRSTPSMPIHLVGFSNGGALAVKYTLDSLQDDSLRRPDQLVLISPMIGVIPLARFAGLAQIPALSDSGRAAWLNVTPEYNPFKYNSMHINVPQQSHRLSSALQEQVASLSDKERESMPPVLTFHSVEDTTVSTVAVISRLYAYLPQNGSELVLFIINRSATYGTAVQSALSLLTNQILPAPPRKYSVTLISNQVGKDDRAFLTTIKAGETEERSRDLMVRFPSSLLSLPHFAVPTPVYDPLYGAEPRKGTEKDYGVNLGLIAAGVKQETQLVNPDFLFRLGSNPFFPYMLERIDKVIERR